MSSKPAKRSQNKLRTQGQPHTLAATQQIATFHEGLLPAPATLRQYEEMIPGAAERLLSLVEREQERRHAREKHILDEAVADTRSGRNAHLRGDFMVILMFIACMSTGIWVLLTGRSEIIAGTLLGTPLIAAIGSLLYQRRLFKESKKELPEKTEKESS